MPRQKDSVTFTKPNYLTHQEFQQRIKLAGLIIKAGDAAYRLASYKLVLKELETRRDEVVNLQSSLKEVLNFLSDDHTANHSSKQEI